MGIPGVFSNFSRLYTDLPDRSTALGLRHSRRTTLKFLNLLKSDDFEWPKRIADIDIEARFYLSRLIDEATLTVYNEAIRLIQKTPEHKANYRELSKAPKNCGGFKVKKAILADANPFEQMVALDHVISLRAQDWPVGRRTYSFYHDDTQVIPLYVASRKACKASIMTTILGAAKGQYKVPTYDELAASEEKARESIFIRPLESLEYVRQPYFSGATVIKANAFEEGIIDNAHRYAVETKSGNPYLYACVEFKGQKSPEKAPVKEGSAGSNILFLKKHSPKKRFVKTLNYEEWNTEGYKDDADTSFKVKDYWNAVDKAVRSHEIDGLVDMTRKLFVSRAGPFTSADVNSSYAEKIFEEG